MEAKEILIKARDIIAAPEHWTKGCLARDKRGFLESTFSDEACQFCSMGALYRAVGRHGIGDQDHELRKAMKAISMAISHKLGKSSSELSDIPSFNDSDHTTHADVLALFDKAIASLGEEA